MYKVEFTRSAHKQFKKLPMEISIRVFNAIAELASNPLEAKTKKLTDIEGYRIRIGDHRVIYTIDHEEKSIRITSVPHRRDAY